MCSRVVNSGTKGSSVKSRNNKHLQRAYRTAGRLLISHLLELGVLYLEITPHHVAPETAVLQRVRATLERVLTLLGGEIAVERGVPTHPFGDRSKHRREAARLLATLNPDHDAVERELTRREDTVRYALLATWPAAKAVAQLLLDNPGAALIDLRAVLSEGLARVGVARAYCVAAMAMARHRLGDEVASLSLQQDDRWTAEGVTVAAKLPSPKQRIAESLLAVRQQWKATEAVHTALAPLLPRMRGVVRDYNSERITDRELLALLVQAERIVDGFAGPIDMSLRTTISEAVIMQAVPVLAGEIAARTASGLEDNNKIERLKLLSLASIVAHRLSEALEHFAAARSQAEAIVAGSWPAIAAVAEALLRNDELSGDEFRTLVADTLPGSDGLVA
jgi:hypothetical protein